MTQTYKNPIDYLNDAVTKRGKSGPDGVYLTNLTVVAEAKVDYNQKLSYGPGVLAQNPPPDTNYEDWLRVLVDIRSDYRALSQEVAMMDNTILQFIPEGNFLNLNVFLPTIETQGFPYMLVLCQDALKCVADFASKIPNSIRFNIGVACKSWGDMVEEGEAVETDLNY